MCSDPIPLVTGGDTCLLKIQLIQERRRPLALHLPSQHWSRTRAAQPRQTHSGPRCKELTAIPKRLEHKQEFPSGAAGLTVNTQSKKVKFATFKCKMPAKGAKNQSTGQPKSTGWRLARERHWPLTKNSGRPQLELLITFRRLWTSHCGGGETLLLIVGSSWPRKDQECDFSRRKERERERDKYGDGY